MSTPPVPQQMSGDGRLLGARQPPSAWSLFCHPPCAISGYVTGDPLDGSCEGPACTAMILYILCGCLGGGLYALLAWKPDPGQIKNDGTLRYLNNRCCDVMCLDGPCAIAFWYSGDICGSTGPGGQCCCDLCQGEAGISCLLNVLISPIVGIGPIGDYYACCCWTPNPALFKRTEAMHGGRAPNAGEAVSGGAIAVVANAVAVTPVSAVVVK